MGKDIKFGRKINLLSKTLSWTCFLVRTASSWPLILPSCWFCISQSEKTATKSPLSPKLQRPRGEFQKDQWSFHAYLFISHFRLISRTCTSTFLSVFPSREWRQSWKCLVVSRVGRGIFGVHGTGKCMTQRSSNVATLHRTSSCCCSNGRSRVSSNKQQADCCNPPLFVCHSRFWCQGESTNFLLDRYLSPNALPLSAICLI